MTVTGYRRLDGRIGIRNHVLVMPVSYEMNGIAQRIAARVPGIATFRHQHGVYQTGDDLRQTSRTFEGFATHPNVTAVVILAWGNESVDVAHLTAQALQAGKKVEVIARSAFTSVIRMIERGVTVAQDFLAYALSQQREPVALSSVILGTECGGSDACSGISANPALGVVSDLLIAQGGISILAETTELIGAEHLLAQRACNEQVAEQILRIVSRIEENAIKMGVDIRGAQPAPGNIAGGITTIEEKSLGCIYKGGTTDIRQVIAYAQRPTESGLVIMDTPGHDIEQLTGMVAGGAQICIFTTGRGTPTGSPIAPVIKVATNTFTYESMQDNIDFDAGSIIRGEETVQQVGNRLYALMLQVMEGQLTKSEVLGHREFGIYRIG